MGKMKNLFTEMNEVPEDLWDSWEDFQFEQAAEAQYLEALSILLSKHRDYGPNNIAGSPGGPLNGLRVRMWDKLARINHLIEQEVSPNHESLRDSFLDLANYSMIALMVIDGEWPDGVS
jgi:hypothetical protein